MGPAPEKKRLGKSVLCYATHRKKGNHCRRLRRRGRRKPEWAVVGAEGGGRAGLHGNHTLRGPVRVLVDLAVGRSLVVEEKAGLAK